MGVSPEKLAGFYKTHVNVKRICEQIQFKCLETLQVNLGNVCNQKCSHCHVNAGPDGKKIMSRMVMEEIIAFLSRHKELTVDITGGCPEMNPDFCYFIEKACEVSQLVMVRTNLTVFLENGFEWLINWYRDHQVTVIGSLPCYTAENVDSQRGSGVFEASIKALRLLNEAGYGVGSGLELDLVYNPGGAFLPPDQQQLETDYKRHLDREYGVTFDNIFTITNAPIGRFRKSLEAQGRLEEYFRLLEENFNPLALHNVMCRTLISVDYRGILYNCDFNQALDLCMKDKHGEPVTIDRLDEILEQQIKIETGKHCFCCTAGVGSSCTGAIVK
ncbi:MAG: radical SAM protein [Planctomycetes bacterium GWF2_41_51]|nr:MAG: radical SAM protein [Planctomycetes bacterium GWF2_41_51]HBG27934.1 DUF3641 domain-containing protein [Phycisphaerales bacterium]